MDRRKTQRREDGYSDIYVLDFAALVDMIWRRRALLMFLTLLILIPGVAFIMMRPSVYEANASVMIENQELNLAEFQNVFPAGKFDEVTVETQARVLASPKVIGLTLDALEAEQAGEETAQKNSSVLRNAKINAFLTNLDVTPQGRSRILEISYKSKDPVQAANVVNTHVEQYVDFLAQNKKEQLQILNTWISEQVGNLKKEGLEKSKAVQEFRKDAGIMLGKNSEDLIYQQITDISAQLVPIETQKLSLQARLEGMSGKNQGALSEVVDSGLVQNLKSQQSSARQELKAMEAQYGPNHPQVLAAKRKISQVNSDIGREVGSIKSAVAMELKAAETQEQLLRARLEELNKQADQLRSKEIELEALEAEETANRTLLDNFLSRYEEIKSQLDFARADVRIVSKAEVPTQPTGPRKSLLIIALGFFALIFATGCVLLLSLVDRGIENADDVRKVLNLRLLGILPRVKNPLGQIGGLTRSAYIEEIRRIYLALAAKKEPQSVLFTAAQSGEGKTTTVMSLASYLASIRAKVIVVDTNARSPAIATIAGTSAAPGFAEYIAGTADLSRIIHKDEDGLAVIPYGTAGAGSIDLLASDAFARLLTTLKAQYDLVLIDCAPLPVSTDTEVIATIADQSVLVVEWGKTSKKDLKTVSEALRQHAKTTPGVILNKRR